MESLISGAVLLVPTASIAAVEPSPPAQAGTAGAALHASFTRRPASARAKAGSDRAARVLVVGNYVPDRQMSMLRYAAGLADGLADCGLEVELLQPACHLRRLPLGQAGRHLAGLIDKYVLFPPVLALRARRHGLVHIADHSNAVYRLLLSAKQPFVVTCHDLFAVRAMQGSVSTQRTTLRGGLLQRLVLKALRGCAAIVCVSDETATDVRTLVSPPLLDVIPNAIRDSLGAIDEAQAQMVLTPLGISPPFFLHVGGNQFYKNRPGVVRLFDRLAALPAFAAHRLVLCGKAPDAALTAAIRTARYADRITTLIAPPDATVEALYRRAEALLFLSTQEGFGWPIIEAQACECLVVTTNRPPMSVIGGDATILVDPDDLDDAVTRIAQAFGRAQQLRAQGRANAERFRAANVYRTYVELYVRVRALNGDA